MTPQIFISLTLAILALLVYALITVRKNSRPSKPRAIQLIRKGKTAQGMAMLRTFADKGDAEAEYLYGMAAHGIDDKKTFIESMRTAATTGYTPATLALAGAFMTGDGTPQDFKQAEELLTPLVGTGNTKAIQLLLKTYAMSDNRAAFDALMAKVDPKFEQSPNPLDAMTARRQAAGDTWKHEMQYKIPGKADTRSEAAQQAQKGAGEKAVHAIHAALTAGCTNCGKVNFRQALNAAGALAGFGCQMGIRDGAIAAGAFTAEDAFAVVDTVSGQKYYLGDALNQALFEFPVSVYSLILGGVVTAGGKALPNIEEMAKRVIASLGSDSFDVLPLPESERPAESPTEALRRFWPLIYPGLRAEYATPTKGGIDPNELGWLFALAAQRLIREAKGEVPADTAGAIAMEAAMRTSKLGPETVAS